MAKEIKINPLYPSVDMLREKARKRIPGFAFDYVDGGCNNEINLARNTTDLREIQLMPYYLRGFKKLNLSTELFGEVYDAPFGVAPVGLQGLIWPGATEILAKAAHEHNIPFILSTVATADIETVAEITNGRSWFQLYHPAEEELRDKLLRRCEEAGIKTLVILSDVPTFGYRPKEIRNGLSIPPKMTWRNMVQITTHPRWALSTLFAGQPEFKTVKPYIPKGLSLRHLGLFMNRTFSGRLNDDRLKQLRDSWKGNLVLKGVASAEDTEKAIAFGLDGIIASNHGGRQLDHGPSTISTMDEICAEGKGKIKIMMDSGIRCGPDIASALAKGAECTFLGRAFMYGVAALGKEGGDQVISILKTELQQIMEQLGCENIGSLSNHLIE
ncbi:alpha-hydroxy acid oxidase [Portibacter marinus]|uniref:alpha-hydroxy acid oxidase n=1 Tax=Portibacter marinus TaxID=2898660 RepID=UPI001F21D22D|nr:alpha-hydroxy acid oxidase [Portibacter marinus]